MKIMKQKRFLSLVMSCILGAFILSMGCTEDKAVDTGLDQTIDQGTIEEIIVEPGEGPEVVSPPPPPSAVCGDGECNGEETAATCPADCEPGLPQASLHQPGSRENVATDLTEIIVRFNEPMNLEAIPATPITLTRVGGEALRGEAVVRPTADGSVSEVVFTLDPGVNLNHYTEYIIAASSEFTDQDGHTLAELGAPTSWNITTAHGWDPAFTVKTADPGETLAQPKATLDAQGNAMIVYRSDIGATHTINFERYVNGRLEPGYASKVAMEDILPTGELLVDSDANGNALVVLGQPVTVLAAYFNQSLENLNARWRDSSNIAVPGVVPEGEPSLDMNASGQAFAVWVQDGNATIYGNHFSGGSWLAAPQKLYDRTANPPRMYADQPMVRINNSGAAKVAWLGGHLAGGAFEPGSRIGSLRFSYNNEARSWNLTSYDQVANCGIACKVYDISQVDRHGNVYALWDQNGPDRTPDTADDGIYVNIRPAGGEWTTLIDNTVEVGNPQIVAKPSEEFGDPADPIVMAWIREGNVRVQVNAEPSLQLNAELLGPTFLQLARGDNSAMAIWLRGPQFVQGRRYQFGETWDSEIPISTVGAASAPFVAMNSSDTIIVVWIQQHEGIQTIQARYYR
ncbi:MAG: Ig-like domain-containing protein [Pseudomonadota bacterium]